MLLLLPHRQLQFTDPVVLECQLLPRSLHLILGGEEEGGGGESLAGSFLTPSDVTLSYSLSYFHPFLCLFLCPPPPPSLSLPSLTWMFCRSSVCLSRSATLVARSCSSSPICTKRKPKKNSTLNNKRFLLTHT